MARAAKDDVLHDARYAKEPVPVRPPTRASDRGRTIRGVNTALRVLLLIWICGYLLVSCGPILGGHLVLGAISLAGGIVFFVPWVIGIAVLAVLIRSTDPPRR